MNTRFEMITSCVLFLAVLSVVSGGPSCTCGPGTILLGAGESANLTSPAYPSTGLCPRLKCGWTITAKGSKARLSFPIFDLAPLYDFLYIYDGDSSGAHLIQSCANKDCKTVKSSGESLYLLFISDGNSLGKYSGFLATAQAMVMTTTSTTISPPPVLNCGQPEIVISQANNQVHFNSPGYPGPYIGKGLCFYQLSSDNGAPVTLHFNLFALGETDSMYIYSGNLLDSTRKLLLECNGPMICPDVNSENGPLTVVFVVGGDSFGAGWSAIASVDSDFTPTTTLAPTTIASSTTSTTTTTSASTSPTTTPEYCSVFAGQGNCLTCYDLKHRYNQTEDGVYPLCLSDEDGSQLSINAYCDMTNGGYTYISQVVDNSVNFNASWAAYENGFGSVGANSSHWLGLRAMHLLTTHCGQSQARFEMGTACPKFGASSTFEDFETFLVGNPSSFYNLSMGGPSGIAGDGRYDDYPNGAMNGMSFSTFDADHDQSTANCAASYASGWWYDACYYSKLTGTWYSDCDSQSTQNVKWYTWRGYNNLQRAAIKVRPPPP